MKALLYPFMVVAAVGLGLSAAVHLCAWTGFEPPGIAMGLHAGVFAVWLPAVLVALRLGLDYGPRDFWSAILRGAPGWMRIACVCVFGCAILNFGVIVLLLPRDGPFAEVNTPKAFSGNWMAFYGAGFVTLYSVLHAEDVDRRRKSTPSSSRVYPAEWSCRQPA